MAAIRSSWSAETTDEWHPDEPSRHQCGVTALVVQDHLGGIIVRNKFGDRTVYFNVLDDGTQVFHDDIYAAITRKYPDQEQTRGQVMTHPDMPGRYATLAARVARELDIRRA